MCEEVHFQQSLINEHMFDDLSISSHDGNEVFFRYCKQWSQRATLNVYTHTCSTYTGHAHIGVGTEGAEGALAPPILGIMCIKYAEFILDTPLGPPPQSCLCSYASGTHMHTAMHRSQMHSTPHMTKHTLLHSLSPSWSVSNSSIIALSSSSDMFSPSSLATRRKLRRLIFPVLSSSNSLKALMISSFGSLCSIQSVTADNSINTSTTKHAPLPLNPYTSNLLTSEKSWEDIFPVPSLS